ncbi:NitT/TauT family transport system substrate-binding protein [Quadrisphaera granulorum]|uniref:Thiamine pyrimidine synthase n=1 Tax=Quadrisphaera granulorum TaxID=317664 RepID=A0A316AHA1_9ACTN|nr:ABC transporter substrate-binding protein [Quadrisphaera granulorum]PWJ56310.1 NitT/TauT family transport system substrate-binding protein [Quadrisphaera granulorum]SZE94944.1 NitT/TauT family transport system substrate-binding protein [Quadrisphaera granulorum]
MTPLRRRSPLAALAAASTAVLLLSACSGSSDEPAGASGGASSASGVIDADRCAKNRDAGTVTYLTGYQYQASTTILEAVAAESMGFFKDVCLDVQLQPGSGDTAQGAQLTAAGRAQLSGVGSAAEAMLAVVGGADVVGVATFGHVPIATLMTEPSITDLKQLDGTTLGHKGSLPAPLRAMLVTAGVDLGSIQQVKVGYDPTVLVRGQVQSLTGYKSNEPLTLAAMGDQITQWNPEDYGVVGSFGQVIANPAFAKEHPTAVQDFLRALLHAHEVCQTELQQCVQAAADKSGSSAGFDVAHNEQVFTTESKLVADSTPAGKPIGFVDAAALSAEAQVLVGSGELTTVPDPTTVFDETYLTAVVGSDGAVLWPAGSPSPSPSSS